jgi:Uma2 family endonuclease
MNAPLTHAADGLMRRAFTVKDVFLMVEAGILGPEERFELIGGEIVPMSPKGIRHEVLKTWVMEKLVRELPSHLQTAPETTFRLSDDTFIEPDFVIYPRGGLAELSPATCLLAIEIADSSLSYDLGRKAQLCAEFGIAELWVMNAVNRETRIHRNPVNGAYADVTDHPAGAILSTPRVPGISLDLSKAA